MRFILHEQPYEKPIAAGQLRYETADTPTGAVESWRLTTAVAGYRILRVDLDARTAPSGHSYLYHLVLSEKGRPERLSYRFWSAAWQVTGLLLFDRERITASRTVNERRFEEEITIPAGTYFWFPSTVGLGLLAGSLEVQRVSAATLSPNVDGPAPAIEELFSLQQPQVDLTVGISETVVIVGQIKSVRPLLIRWHDQERMIWLDEHHWPVKMRRDDGLTAVATRYIRY